MINKLLKYKLNQLKHKTIISMIVERETEDSKSKKWCVEF